MTYYDLQGLLFLDFIETTAQGPIYNYIKKKNYCYSWDNLLDLFLQLECDQASASWWSASFIETKGVFSFIQYSSYLPSTVNLS